MHTANQFGKNRFMNETPDTKPIGNRLGGPILTKIGGFPIESSRSMIAPDPRPKPPCSPDDALAVLKR